MSDKRYTVEQQMRLEHPACTSELYGVIGRAGLIAGQGSITAAALACPDGMPLPSDRETLRTLALALMDALDTIAAVSAAYIQATGKEDDLASRAHERFLRCAGVMSVVTSREAVLKDRTGKADKSRLN